MRNFSKSLPALIASQAAKKKKYFYRLMENKSFYFDIINQICSWRNDVSFEPSANMLINSSFENVLHHFTFVSL